MNPEEFEYLLKLLDDESREIQELIKDSIQDAYFELPVERWKEIADKLDHTIKKKINAKYRQFHLKFFDLFLSLWAQEHYDKYKVFLDNLEKKGLNISVEPFLSNFLYLVSRLTYAFLTIEEFNSLFDDLLKSIPNFFASEYTTLEQARYFSWLFYKWEKFFHTQEIALELSFSPYSVMKKRKGSNFAIAIIIIALAEKLGLQWYIVSDIYFKISYVVIPVDKNFSLQPLLLNTTSGVILSHIPNVINMQLVRLMSSPQKRLISVYNFLSAYRQSVIFDKALFNSLNRAINFLKKKIK